MKRRRNTTGEGKGTQKLILKAEKTRQDTGKEKAVGKRTRASVKGRGADVGFD